MDLPKVLNLMLISRNVHRHRSDSAAAEINRKELSERSRSIIEAMSEGDSALRLREAGEFLQFLDNMIQFSQISGSNATRLYETIKFRHADSFAESDVDSFVFDSFIDNPEYKHLLVAYLDYRMQEKKEAFDKVEESPAGLRGQKL